MTQVNIRIAATDSQAMAEFLKEQSAAIARVFSVPERLLGAGDVKYIDRRQLSRSELIQLYAVQPADIEALEREIFDHARRLTIDELGALNVIGAELAEHLPGPTQMYLEQSPEWRRAGGGWFRRQQETTQ